MGRRDILPAMAAEAPALLRALEEGLLALEIGESARDASQSVFRCLHTIWAGACLAGLVNLERLSGRMEMTIRLLLVEELAPRQHLIDALLQAADLLATMLSRLSEAQALEIGGCLRALDAALSAELSPEFLDRLKPAPVTGHTQWQASPWVVERVLGQEYGLFKATLTKEAQQNGDTLYARLCELLTLGQLLSCSPGDDHSLELFYASPLEPDLLAEALSLPRQYLLSWRPSGLTPSHAPATPPPEVEDTPRSPKTTQASLAEVGSPTDVAPQPGDPSLVEADDALERPEHYLVFHLGSETYGVEVSPVREIITLPPLTPLPLSPDYILGVMNLAGAVVPVFDLRIKLGMPTDEGKGEPIVVVVDLGDKMQGVVVDAVDDVLGLPAADIQEPPEMTGPVHVDCLTGLVQRDEVMIILVDLALLLSRGPVDHAA